MLEELIFGNKMTDFTKYDIAREHFIKTGKLNPPALREYSQTIGNLLVTLKLSNSWTWGDVTHDGHLNTYMFSVATVETVDGLKALQILIGPVMIMAGFFNRKGSLK